MVRYYNFWLQSSMSCTAKTTTVNVSTQTVIRVYPHILDQKGSTSSARISSDKRMQTEITIKPDQQIEKFYSLLRFTPYQDIQENCIRIINLPRQVRLQFTHGVEFDKMEQAARQFSMADDDGVGYICCELIHRLERRQKLFYADANVQTDLKVHPSLLEDQRIATIVKDTSLQTDDPPSAVPQANIVPGQGNMHHDLREVESLQAVVECTDSIPSVLGATSRNNPTTSTLPGTSSEKRVQGQESKRSPYND